MRLLYFLLVCTTALLLNEANAYNGDEYSTCISQLRHEVRKQNQIRKSKIQECKALQENGRTNEAVHGRGQNPEERPVQAPQTDENRRRLEQPALQHSWDRSTEAPRRSYYDEERQRQEAENRWQEEQRRRQEEEARRWEDTKRRQEEIQRQEEANRRREEQIRRQEEEERGLRNRHREEEATSFTPSSTGEEEAARRLDDQRRRQEEATRRWEEEKRRQEEEERGLRNRHREEGVTSFIPFSAGNYVPNVKVPKFPPGFPFPPKCDRIPDVPGLEFPEGISSGYTSSRITTTKTHETFLCSDPRFQEEFYMAKTTLTTNSEDGVLQNSNNSNANYYYQNKQPFDWSPDVRVESPF